ncbi:hypothetical protein [Streptomyces natalensis]|uniref:Uncharacterized protein n=1 Tax=Streptomyces natalensis ATCC 27448 TaxID=1240678 RepID=A0A0D7CE23_9ACTN|nr:hypothetical protein [Streptomyces natalensis]KIZ14503.1 hypothetical protein SNA_36155 [Streptomyces natalensis ATCC 27448]
MSLRIFETDPNALPKTFSSDFVGRFRAGQLLNNRPVALPAWRITTGDPEVADAVAGLYGGTPQEWETTKEDNREVLTTADSVRVIVEGAEAISSRMALYGMQGVIHACDGVSFLEPEEDRGKPCGCPTDFKERRALAKSGRGPKPDIRISYRLADAPHLGVFRLVTSSWDFTRSLPATLTALDKVQGPALCDLYLELVEFTTSAGVDVTYRHPLLKVRGPAPADVEAALPSLSKSLDEPPF